MSKETLKIVHYAYFHSFMNLYYGGAKVLELQLLLVDAEVQNPLKVYLTP
jgi:hypothetical protein